MKTTINFSAINPTRLVLLSIALLLLGSCKKALEVELPTTQIAAGTAFSTDATALAVLSNIYIKSAGMTSGNTGSVTNMGAFLADECTSYSTNVNLAQLASGQLIPSNTYSSSLWNTAYSTIYQSNVLIEGLAGNTQVSAAVAKQLRGEALFFRAFSHLYLSIFFGKVPLVTTSDYRINAAIPQSEVTAVQASVIADLLEAKTLLAADYSGFSGERVRLTTWAASALLARAYLYSGNWQQAKVESTRVIQQTALFSLSPLNESFLKNAKEQIMQFKPPTTFVAAEATNFLLTAKPTQLALTSAFYNHFEPGDLRKSSWTGKVTASAVDYYFPYKYKVKTATVLSEYSSMLRLGEMYLIRAEASARLDELPAAIFDVDAIRGRAGLQPIAQLNPIIAKNALLDEVLEERKSELFTEWAHRWIDLQRFGKALSVIGAHKPGFTAKALLLPLPDYDLRTNTSLIQNPGY